MTPHFKTAEPACKCGCGLLPQQDFMDKVEQLRATCGFAMAVTSAAMRAGFTGIGVQQKGAGRFIHLDDLIRSRQ